MSFAETFGQTSHDAPYQSLGTGSGFSMPACKKEVKAAIKHTTDTTAEIAKMHKAILAARGSSSDQRGRVYSLINSVRETARGATATLRVASDVAPALHQVEVSSLQDELRAALSKFHAVAESVSSSLGPPPVRTGSAEMEPLGHHDHQGVYPGGATAPLMASDIGRARGAAPDLEAGHQAQVQDHAVLEQTVAMRQEVIDEREQGIAAVQQSVRDVQEIFQDLALLVHEQGAQIDNIQTNVENATARVTRGVGELQTAQRSQKRYRRKLCTMCVLAAIGIVAFLMVLKFALKVAMPLR
mmetsp:Transcript_7109/g.19342  ORF Transcript_7109/g.19342 Transcript_7109/m.19342 type:complete len:299 (-) Transcript_7109:212-1108(-)